MPTYYNNLQGGVATSGGSSSGVANFGMYRQFSNKVQARLTDVSFASGYVWQDFSVRLELVYPSGAVAGSVNVSKHWGVMGAWTTIATGLPLSSLRNRYNGTYYSTANAGGQWVEIRFDLRYGADI